jgi:hypothetical protein
VFFFEKKNQKLWLVNASGATRRLQTDKNLLLLFFRKEGLPSGTDSKDPIA